MIEPNAFLRELHHRVKNNFQIIASLINLQKRLLPAERRGDLRFIEEHVQSMAVAYRVVWAANEFVSVVVNELVIEVLDSLRHIAGGSKQLVTLDLATTYETIGLDQAIALSLYLAVIVPPFLDRAAAAPDGQMHLSLVLDGEELLLTITGNWADPVALDFLHRRIADAYMRQLNAVAQPDLPEPARGIRFALETPHPDMILNSPDREQICDPPFRRQTCSDDSKRDTDEMCAVTELPAQPAIATHGELDQEGDY